jgi:hypothetical protein
MIRVKRSDLAGAQETEVLATAGAAAEPVEAM